MSVDHTQDMQANTDLHPDEVPWLTGSGDFWRFFSQKTLPGFHIKKAGVYRSSLKHGICDPTTGWWFGTCFIFHFIYGIILLIDELIFFKMVIAPPTSHKFAYFPGAEQGDVQHAAGRLCPLWLIRSRAGSDGCHWCWMVGAVGLFCLLSMSFSKELFQRCQWKKAQGQIDYGNQD